MRKAKIPGANVSVRRRCDRCITTSYASRTHLVRDEIPKYREVSHPYDVTEQAFGLIQS